MVQQEVHELIKRKFEGIETEAHNLLNGRETTHKKLRELGNRISILKRTAAA